MTTEQAGRMIELLEAIHDLSRQQAHRMQEIKDILAGNDVREPPSIIDETTPLGAEIAERLRRVDEAA